MSNTPIIKTISESQPIPVDNARDATIRILLGPVDQMPNFHTRLFCIEPGGRIPEHRHDTIEHEQVILEGTMVIGLDGEEKTVREGQCVYIPAGCGHWYENRGTVPVRFLCMIPGNRPYATEWLEPPAR